MNQQLLGVINSYPLIIPRFYNYLRLLILPLEEIAKYIPKKGAILDVGCGYGVLDIYLAKTSSNRRVIGSELNHKRVRIASRTAKNIDNVSFFEQDLLQNRQIEQVDCVILVDLLHHVSYSQQRQLLQSVSSILKPGGRLIVKDLDTKPKFKFYWNLVHDKLVTGFDRLYFQSSQTLARTLEEEGFSVSHKNISNLFYAHHLFVCEKR